MNNNATQPRRMVPCFACSAIFFTLIIVSFIPGLAGCAGSPRPPDAAFVVALNVSPSSGFLLSVQNNPPYGIIDFVTVSNPTTVPITITSIALNDRCVNANMKLDYANMTCISGGNPLEGGRFSRTLQPAETCTITISYPGGGPAFTDGILTILGGTTITAEPKELAVVAVKVAP